MILVDTSVFIDYFRNQPNSKTIAFENILRSKITFGITSVIYQEILQGAISDKEFHTLKNYLDCIPFYYLKDDKDSYASAAVMRILCKKAGFTIRSTVDLIIAQVAIENELVLLHNDSDFDKIAKIIPSLKIH